MQLKTEQLTAWNRDGTLVVSNVFSEEETVPALEAIERNAYDGLTYAEYRTKWNAQPEALKSAYEKNSDMQRLAGPFGKALHFPTGLETVDRLLARTTPAARRVLGWPAPGDAYYTPEALARLEQAYPGIDLEPYRK